MCSSYKNLAAFEERRILSFGFVNLQNNQEQRIINDKLYFITAHLKEQPIARIQYFVPDGRKK